MRSAPACSASATCSPKRAKSAERMEGAILMMRLSIIAILRIGCLEDALNRSTQLVIELGIGLLRGQPFRQRTRKARHHAVIPAQAVVGIGPRKSTGQRDHPQNLRVSDAIRIKVVPLR